MPREANRNGWHRGHFTFSIDLVAPGAGATERVTDFVAGFGFIVERMRAYVDVAGTGAGATKAVRVIKGAATVAATLTATLANTAVPGAEIATSALGTLADRTFNDADTFTLDLAAGTLFTAGRLIVVVQYRYRAQQISGTAVPLL